MHLCGYQSGLMRDSTRPNWDDTNARPISWNVWYPCDGTSRDAEAERIEAFFDLGPVIPDVRLADGGPFSVVLLSHGTGGAAHSLGWLARALACRGHVVIGANHHGNTAAEPYRAEGFLCWWERAADLSAPLAHHAARAPFAGRLDMRRAVAIGFSLGGHRVLALAGARTSVARFDAWRQAAGISAQGPREFPDLGHALPDLLATSGPFKASWHRQGADYTDTRITSVIALAPALPVRAFSTRTIGRIEVPLHVISSAGDQEAPAAHGAAWLAECNRAFEQSRLGQDVGHGTFLGLPTDRSLVGQVDLFTDKAGVNRAKVHAQVLDIVLRALR